MAIGRPTRCGGRHRARSRCVATTSHWTTPRPVASALKRSWKNCRSDALLASIAEEADVLESQLIALDELVPGDYDIAGFIVELDTIADDLGIRLRDVVPAQSADDGHRTPAPRGWSSVAPNALIAGSYVDLIDFVEVTTRTDRLAGIDSITITTYISERSTR